MRSYCSIGMWRGYQWDIIGCEVHNIITWQNNTLDPHGSKKPENWLTHDSVQGLEAWGQFLIDMPIISIYTVVYNTIYIHRSSPTAKTPEQKQKVSGCESASVLLQVASLQLSDATSSASSLAASYSSSSPPSSSLLCKACRFPHQHLYDISRCRTFRILPLPSSLPQCLSKSRCFRDRKGCCASRTSGLGYQPACCIASQGKMPQVNRSLRGTVASGGINFIKVSLQRSRNPCLVKKHLEELPQVGYEGPDLGICQRLVQTALLQKKWGPNELV